MIRKAYSKLLEWKKSSKNSKAILIQGARRVGKSYLSEEFAKNEYKSYILIDFSSPLKGTLKIFNEYGNKSQLNDLFNALSVLYSTPLYEHNSVILFDEVQKYPKARELIKHLVADNRYDFIETGSLISIKKNTKDILIPSEEQSLNLYPMDFEEFLLALGDITTIPYLKNCFDNKIALGNLLKPINEKLRSYMIIGGMPQAVKAYVETKNYDKVERVKSEIIKLYREDIVKYAENTVAEATAIFNAIPTLLSHHDKKIKYSSLNEGDRFSCYRDAIQWIENSMVGNLAYGIDEPSFFEGFAIQVDKIKCYMGDTGLLLTLSCGDNYLTSNIYKSFILGKISINHGMMTENLVAQIFRANGYKLRFFEKIEHVEGESKKYEVDFLLQNEKCTAIEVKSGNVKEYSSLDYFNRKFKKVTNKSIVLTKGDLREDDKYIYYPLAMAIFL